MCAYLLKFLMYRPKKKEWRDATHLRGMSNLTFFLLCFASAFLCQLTGSSVRSNVDASVFVVLFLRLSAADPLRERLTFFLCTLES